MRFLKFATLVMGIMIIVLTIVVAVEIYRRATNPEYKAMRMGTSVEALENEGNFILQGELDLPVGVVVNSVTALDHGKIAVHISLPEGGQKLLYIDSRTGDVFGETVLVSVP